MKKEKSEYRKFKIHKNEVAVQRQCNKKNRLVEQITL